MSMDIFSIAEKICRMKKIVESLIPRESSPARVGPRVSGIRAVLNLSKAEFADSIELDRSTLTKVEKGEKGLDIAKGERIADLYAFGLDFIYRGDLSDVPLEYRATLVKALENPDTKP